jgi:uncharacterized short protein YbdD (DUF466 family)
MRVWSFGDSWAYGHGLEDHDPRFGDFVAMHQNVKHINKGECGSSLGQVVHEFTTNYDAISKDDIILFVLPPDIRWYDMLHPGQINSLMNGMPEYDEFLKNKTVYWFTYHHSLFIYTLGKMCEDKGCKFIMAHNYGRLHIEKQFTSIVKDEWFLNKSRSLTAILGAKDYENYGEDLKDDGPPHLLESKYFIPGDNHPNIRGHKKIGKLIMEKLDELYK